MIEYNVFEFRDVSFLLSLLEGKNNLIVEVGSWVGRSAYALASRGQVYCVDRWDGCGNKNQEEEAKEKDIFALFRENCKELWHNIYPMYMYSADAARVFKDGVLDLVYIDANHSYEAVKQDIILWTPKLKPNGILCGHDYDLHGDAHNGVKKALEELFGKNFKRVGQSTVWVKT